jgi:hypothetical protein
MLTAQALAGVACTPRQKKYESLLGTRIKTHLGYGSLTYSSAVTGAGGRWRRAPAWLTAR